MKDLSPATQLALLLTARWANTGCKPLTNGEFLDFRRWLGASQESAETFLNSVEPPDDAPVESERLRCLLSRGFGVFQSVEKWGNAGLWIASLNDTLYPSRFKQLKSRAPILVFGYGDPNAFGRQALAIVGSRDASSERLHKAAEVGRACAAKGITVVSGGARGIDSAAMEAGMVGAGTVVGVLSDSLLRAAGKRSYRDAIIQHRLCLMSEVHPEARFEVGNAMARNRLAYACGDAALVVECDPKRGGTWAGALEALKEGKAVYVLRGARAEKQLASEGAVVVDMDFALHPDRFLVGERPEATPVAPSQIEAAIRNFLPKNRPTAVELAERLRLESVAFAEAIIFAAEAEGWYEVESEPALEPTSNKTKRGASRKDQKPQVIQETPRSSLFGDDTDITNDQIV